MRRREFLGIVGGAAAAWPAVAGAQQRIPVIGLLRNTHSSESIAVMVAMRQGLKELGFIEGQNVQIEYRWAGGDIDRLPELAEDLVRRDVAVIVAGGNNETRAAKKATTTIPIVFSTGDDPVRLGHVGSLNRPEGNVTGATFFSGSGVMSKRLELLHELVPKTSTVAYLVNPSSAQGGLEMSEALSAAPALGLDISVFRTAHEREFEAAFTSISEKNIRALIVGGDVLFLTKRATLVALAARRRIPTTYQLREYVTAGGLMSYGASIANTYRQAGTYVARILKGAKSGDLPVLLPTKFDLTLNLGTAQALGLDIPHKVLALADEVIE